MLYLYIGTDRDAARTKMNSDVAKQKRDATRVTDAHTVEDLRAALQGGGMFFPQRAVIFEGVCANPDMCSIVLDALPLMKESADTYYVFEEKPLADLRKKLEKYAEKVEKFELPKKVRDSSIFATANALKRGDKKTLWVAYVREIEKGSAPEAVHGVLFWAAKDMLIKSSGKDDRARKLVAQLAELPHEARRRGEDLEYALERFVLSGA